MGSLVAEVQRKEKVHLQRNADHLKKNSEFMKNFHAVSMILTLCLPVSSADNLGKQFGPRSGTTNHQV